MTAVPLLALVLAQPPAKADPGGAMVARVLELKPAAADANDHPIRKLQKERYNARLAAAQSMAKAVKAQAGVASDLTGLVMVLAENAADLEENPAGRVKWLRLRVDLLRERERSAAAGLERDKTNPIDVALATAARADAEIDLLLFQEFLKGGPPPEKRDNPGKK